MLNGAKKSKQKDFQCFQILSDDMLIQLFIQKQKKMNYQPIFFQNYSSPTMNDFYANSPAINKKSPVLNELSQALKISFHQYCQYLQNSCRKIGDDMKSVETQKEKQTICIELLSDNQQQKQQSTKKKISSKPKINQKQLQIKLIEDKTDQSLEAHQEKIQNTLIADQSNNSNVVTKTAQNKNQHLNKLKPINKKSNSPVIVPSIDLVDTVQIKNIRIDSDELLKKKKSLLLRNVQNWNDATKDRKQRRQLRMLKK